MSDQAKDTIRLDKWLWQARFFKSRSLAAGIGLAGEVRVVVSPVSKPARGVGHGNILTFMKETEKKVIRIVACGTRRGPAPEAQALYEDLSPEPVRNIHSRNPSFDGKGRPTKRDRRNLMTHRGGKGSLDLD